MGRCVIRWSSPWRNQELAGAGCSGEGSAWCAHMQRYSFKKTPNHSYSKDFFFFFFLSNAPVFMFFHLVSDTYCLLTAVSAPDLVHRQGENVCDSIERQFFHSVGSLFTLQETLKLLKLNQATLNSWCRKLTSA